MVSAKFFKVHLYNPLLSLRNSDSGVSFVSDLVRAWLDQLEISSEDDFERMAQLLKEISDEQKRNCAVQLGKLAQVLVPVRKKSRSEHVGSASLLVGAACEVAAFWLHDRPAASVLRAAAAATYLLVSLRAAVKSWKLRKEVILLLESEEFQGGVNLLFEELKKTEERKKAQASGLR